MAINISRDTEYLQITASHLLRKSLTATASDITTHPVITRFISKIYQSTIHFDVFVIWLLNKGVTLHLLRLNNSPDPESITAVEEG